MMVLEVQREVLEDKVILVGLVTRVLVILELLAFRV
jgi:hypothetical protein